MPAGKTPSIADEAHIASYVRVFDGAVLWQPASPKQNAVFNWERGIGPSVDQLSYLTLIALALAVVGGPVAAWRSRDDPALVGTFGFLWLTILYGFVTTSLLDLGENPRFSFELGSLPVVAAVAVLVSLLTRRGVRPSSRRA